MNGTLRYVIRRFGWALVVVAGVTSLSFVVAHVLPGDPARMLLGPQAAAEDIRQARAIYGLDRPLAVQYVWFWRRLLHFHAPPEDERSTQAPAAPAPEHQSCASLGFGVHLDLGYSFYYRKPVTELLKAKIPRSIELALAAMAIQLTFGIGLGVFAASRRATAWDELTIGVTLVGVSAPTFLLGLVLQYILAYRLRVLPYDGYGTTSAEHLRCIILPALTLGVFGTALYARLARDELIGLLSADYVRTARAKGASKRRALWVHALRNALVPIATLAALELGTLVGGAIVTEKLFRWPGVGQMAVDALLNRDGPVITATVLFASAAVVLSTMLLDVAYLGLDPRLRKPANHM